MNFTLDEPNYNIENIKFNVDDILSNKIKEPFANTSFFMCIIGKPGSGKTNLLINMLKNKEIYKKVFDKIILVMPKNSMASMKNNIFADIPEDQQFNEIEPAILAKILSIRKDFDTIAEEEKRKEKPKRSRNMLVIFDDVMSQMKDKENLKLLQELASNHRHLKCSIIMISQYLRCIPRCVRSQFTNVAFFKPSNEMDNDILREEFVNLPKDKFLQLTRFIFENAHDFMMIDKNKETYYKNLQKINY